MKTDRIASVPALLTALSALTQDELLVFTDNPGKVKEFLNGLVSEGIQNIYVVPLSDTELKEQFPQFSDRLPSWRKVAAELDYRGPVAWKVKAGYTLKEHASQDKNSCSKLDYLQQWNPKNDEPTKDSLVFWVPRLAEGSTSKTIPQMEKLRQKQRQRYELPDHHAKSFGSIALLFALILAHFKRTGERTPLQYLYAASDSFHVYGDRLIAGHFSEVGLYCSYWNEGAGGVVGFFLLGVEELGS